MTTPREALAPLAQRVLRALFELALLDRPAHAGVLAAVLGARATDVARVLVSLDQEGLVAADRARLTLRGLALAVHLPALGLEAEQAAPTMPGSVRSVRALAKMRHQRAPRMPAWTPVARVASR